MANHTPGPWRVIAFAAPDVSKGIEGSKGRPLATVTGQGAETNAANACLIAAAPDLLSAAEAATRHCFIQPETEMTIHGCKLEGHAELRAAINQTKAVNPSPTRRGKTSELQAALTQRDALLAAAEAALATLIRMSDDQRVPPELWQGKPIITDLYDAIQQAKGGAE